ncbi:MAG: hypothetical protein V9G22_06115 [Ottowia sp.]
MQIVTHPLGGNVFRAKSGLLVHQLEIDVLLAAHVDAQALPFRARTLLHLVTRDGFAGVVDFDLNSHEETP